MFHEILVNQKSQSKPLAIDLKDVSPSEFEYIVVYMYTGHVCFETVEELCFGLYAAERFAMNIKTECFARLQSVLSNDGDMTNALKVFQLRDRFQTCAEDADIYGLCEDIISKNYTALLACDALMDCDVNSMARLLSMKTEHEVSEIEVFRALFKWIRATCVKKGLCMNAEWFKAVGGELIYLIRYACIPLELLNKEVVSSGLLSDSCIKMLLNRAYDDAMDVPFCAEPRHVVEGSRYKSSASTTSVSSLYSCARMRVRTVVQLRFKKLKYLEKVA